MVIRIESLIISIIIIFSIYIIIGALWKWAERRFYGKVTPRLLDDIIAIILAVSLFFNFK